MSLVSAMPDANCEILKQLSRLFSAQKHAPLADPACWKKCGNNLRAELPLDILGQETAKLRLLAQTRAIAEDARLSVSLLAEGVYLLERAEWNPPKPHTNPHSNISPQLSRIFIDKGQAHVHAFEANAAHGLEHLKGKLPFAEPINGLQNIDDFVAYVERRWRLNGLHELMPPPWEEKQLIR